jgi:hypothetical protein
MGGGRRRKGESEGERFLNVSEKQQKNLLQKRADSVRYSSDNRRQHQQTRQDNQHAVGPVKRR